MHTSIRTQLYKNLYKRVQTIAEKLGPPINTECLMLPIDRKTRHSTDNSASALAFRKDTTPLRKSERDLSSASNTSHLKLRSLSPIMPSASKNQQIQVKVETRQVLPSLSSSKLRKPRRKVVKVTLDVSDSLLVRTSELSPTQELDDSGSFETPSMMGPKYNTTTVPNLPKLKAHKLFVDKSRSKSNFKRSSVRTDRLAVY